TPYPGPSRSARARPAASCHASPDGLGRSCRRPCTDCVRWKIELHHRALIVLVGRRTEGADTRVADADDVLGTLAQVDPRQHATTPAATAANPTAIGRPHLDGSGP